MTALRLSFDGACAAAHAFHTWTTRIALWWPRSHTMTGEEHLDVVLEPYVDGRIYERTRTGAQVDWGQVVRWEPPVRLGFRWHLAADASHATDVELTFAPSGPGATRVDLVHTAGSGSAQRGRYAGSATPRAGARCSRTSRPRSTSHPR